MTSGKANSSTSSKPSSASRAASSVDVIPDARFAPDRFQASRRTGERIELAIAVVVVLPFVADTSATPAGRRRASASTAAGSSFQTSFPGKVVPPPRRVARDRRPTKRAAEVSSASRAGIARAYRQGLALPRLLKVEIALPWLHGTPSAPAPCPRGDRHGRARGLPRGSAAPLHGRRDPRGAPRLGGASREVPDDARVC